MTRAITCLYIVGGAVGFVVAGIVAEENWLIAEVICCIIEYDYFREI